MRAFRCKQLTINESTTMTKSEKKLDKLISKTIKKIKATKSQVNIIWDDKDDDGDCDELIGAIIVLTQQLNEHLYQFRDTKYCGVIEEDYEPEVSESPSTKKA